MSPKITCLIPVRSGSKRIKNKNIRKINGVPLVKYVCSKIIKSKKINRFYLASDKISIFNKLGKLKKNISFFERSKRSSYDNSHTETVIEEFLNKTNIQGIIILLQVTNPFVNHSHLDKAISLLKEKRLDCVLSAVKSKSFYWTAKKNTNPINYNFNKRKFSQDYKGHFVENGSFYIFYQKNFLKYKKRLHGRIGIYEMPKESIHEIDDKKDLQIISKLLRNKN